ncbi:MAG: GNAT family N-acetyltransferase [Burkholderiales bacterium]|nr:MAG: hypothetical protein CBB82_05090 [Betaproteobacteria bacterium TMED22]|tara:strand:- start:50640 stop:51767 length:1128 start_codon:yes stop_codon:yes gene_type:complete
MNNVKFDIVHSLSGIKADDWNSLNNGHTVTSYEFLAALEETQNVGEQSGWLPSHLIATSNERLVGAAPLYIKTHSYGEYIFDWAWADAYHRSGLDYYPKLVSAVPFTPTTGPRLLAAEAEIKNALANATLSFAKDNQLSSFHCLYPEIGDLLVWKNAGCLLRKSIQFHWTNQNYENFTHYLSSMKSAKRKKIKQERKRLIDNDLSFKIISGDQACEDEWEFFYDCYQHTYAIRGSSPYLNFNFFLELKNKIGKNTLLIIASQSGERVASALNILSNDTILGRYWGAKAYIPGLHFETCYYQTIEYAIKHGYKKFEGGAQGEHKLSRGLEGVETNSAHWLAHPQFSDAVGNFLDREGAAIGEYHENLTTRTPFKNL